MDKSLLCQGVKSHARVYNSRDLPLYFSNTLGCNQKMHVDDVDVHRESWTCWINQCPKNNCPSGSTFGPSARRNAWLTMSNGAHPRRCRCPVSVLSMPRWHGEMYWQMVYFLHKMCIVYRQNINWILIGWWLVILIGNWLVTNHFNRIELQWVPVSTW